ERACRAVSDRWYASEGRTLHVLDLRPALVWFPVVLVERLRSGGFRVSALGTQSPPLTRDACRHVVCSPMFPPAHRPQDFDEARFRTFVMRIIPLPGNLTHTAGKPVGGACKRRRSQPEAI